MHRCFSLLLSCFILLNGAVFALNPDVLAKQVQELLLNPQGKLQWNSVSAAFKTVLQNVDPDKTVPHFDSAQLLLPQLVDAILNADSEVALFRYHAVKTKNPTAALLSFVKKAGIMQAHLTNLDVLVSGIADSAKKALVEKKNRDLRSKVLYLWLANMDFDPDSLGGLPPMGGSDADMNVQCAWDSEDWPDNQNFRTYMEAQEAMKTLVQEIGRDL